MAVVRTNTLENHTREEIAREVVARFGEDYAIGGVLTLEELGFTEYPINASGKIVKRELQEAAVDHVA